MSKLIYKIILLFSIASCQNHKDKSSSTTFTDSLLKIDSNKKNFYNPKLKDLNGFYIFRDRATYFQITRKLKELNVIFKTVPNTDLYTDFWEIYLDGFKGDCDKLRIIKVYNLDVTGVLFDSAQIAFYRDTLFSFGSYSNAKNITNYGKEIHEESNPRFNSQVMRTKEFAKELYDRMVYKYSTPSLMRGKINSPEEEKDRRTPDEELYSSEFRWFNPDTSVLILLVERDYENKKWEYKRALSNIDTKFIIEFKRGNAASLSACNTKVENKFKFDKDKRIKDSIERKFKSF